MEFQPHWCYSFESLLTFVVIVCYSMQHRWFLLNSTTLYNAILRIARMFLETRENIKISTHPFYHINLGLFSWEWSKKNIFFFEKKIQNGRLKKNSFFKIANSQNFFAKISQIRPTVSRIEWCEGHWCSSTYMVVRLSDKSSKTAKKYRKCIFWLFLSFCQTASRPYTLSYIDALCIIQSY